MATLNRSAVVVEPKRPFLDWLHMVDPTSQDLTLPDLVQEPTIYLIPECDTGADVVQALRELCEEIFTEFTRATTLGETRRNRPFLLAR